MLKTKSIYKHKEKTDGQRILISRLHPRGIKKSQYDVWIKELAPSMTLVREYKNNEITWKKFFSKYKKELQESPESLNFLKTFRKQSKTDDITLLCFEPEGIPCHRHVLREIIVKPRFLMEDSIPKFTDK